jgi:hypothetical protein
MSSWHGILSPQKINRLEELGKKTSKTEQGYTKGFSPP